MFRSGKASRPKEIKLTNNRSQYADPPQTPPPAGSTALIALCILPFLSLCCSLYFFYLRHRRSRKKQLLKMRMENQELRSGGYAYPTVNFIVDPGYFARMAGELMNVQWAALAPRSLTRVYQQD